MKAKWFSMILVCVMLLASFVPAAGAEQTGRGYLIGSAAPLTPDQVAQLQQAGASLTYVYKNFGGAAGTIPSNKINAVRALPFVTSVNEDTIKQLHSMTLAPQSQSGLPGSPYWLDLIDAETIKSYDQALTE